MRTPAFILVLAAALAGGCGSQLEDELDVQGRPGPPPVAVEGGGEPVAAPEQPSERCAPGSHERLGTARVAYAARARGAVAAFRRPGGARTRVFERTNVNGVRTVFGVLAVVRHRDCRAAWYRVQLPVRPNGATGYVRADRVRLFRVRTRIEIDLAERRIDFFRDGRRVLRVPAAIGKDGTPTPVGRYYVNQRLLAPDPSGPFGPGAIGISAFSPVLTGWTQGGPIAIHGTNAPSSIGTAASYGCLRIENRHARRMLYANPEGTPVVIRA
ncbi:MAG TPA: L,D-transpeptidase [Gaiellaceae bacterium]|nr:L,D-transpeptidase [Gaiellaceae bacterium]